MTVHRTATVPPGMSCVNAFMALWQKSKPIELAGFISIEPISSAEKVANLFRKNTYFDWIGGLPIKTNFSNFPELDVSIYDDYFGMGAAQKALEEYNNTSSDQRFDRNDFYQFDYLTRRS